MTHHFLKSCYFLIFESIYNVRKEANIRESDKCSPARPCKYFGQTEKETKKQIKH